MARRFSKPLVIIVSSVVSPLVLAQTNDCDCADFGSCLRISTFAWSSSSCISLTVSGTETGHLYDVFYADSLVPPVKWKLAEKGIAAMGSDLIWTDCGSPNRLPPSAVSSRFYTAGIGDDTDGDGLGDAYEVLVLHTDPYQSHTGNGPLSDGEADFDGDGYSNLQEYNSGTDPLDPNSFPTSVRTYGEFALWSHINGGLYFGAGDVFTGHVHADDTLYFSNAGGGPIFHGPVTSDSSNYVGNITGIEFDQGLTLNSYQGTMADINFNSGSSSLKNIASSGGTLSVQIAGNATITFNGGTVSITNPTKGWTNYSYSIPASGGIIYVANNGSTTGSTAGIIYLQGGAIAGRLTVVSENDMYVQNNITYTHNPLTTPTTTDALGLISQDDIWISTSAPNNLTIDAAMIAAGTSGDGSAGSFGALNYSTRSAGTLTLLGGIVQYQRGAVCTFNSYGQVIHGYAKSYSYDTRFLVNPPPYYPVILDPHQ